MKCKWKKKLSSLLIVVLLAVTFIPQLRANAEDAEVFIGNNGTVYDADYEPDIYDEDEGFYDEDDDDNSDVTVLDDDASPSNASPSNGSKASPSNIASNSNWAKIFKTEVFTDAGPFMPAVSVQSKRRALMRAFSLDAQDGNDTSALELSKKAIVNGDGSYTITMEAYTTGKVTVTTTTTPVDIVLVLDQSGSMARDFNGNNTSNNTDRRQYAMKQAVTNFVTEVGKRYDAANSDHRMSIVTFGTDASILQNWTYVSESGANELRGKVAGLPNSPSGATNVAAGMTRAETLMGSGYNYTGVNTQRQKVVIVFTDGVPTTSTEFDTTVANGAIESSKNLKDSGVTVYSIGIFNGAKPNQLYGDEGFDRNSDGTVGSDWSDFSFFMLGDVKNYDVPAGNRFLNYLSSNFASATTIGIENYKKTFFGIGYHGWKIIKNFDRDESGYYLTADDSEELNNVFTKISENISQADTSLDSTTTIKDIVTPYFHGPQDASDIQLYTADFQENGTFADRVEASDDIKAFVQEDTISVTGFDYYHNFVDVNMKGRDENDMNAGGTFYGRKLIIEFTVTRKAGFLGGNNVPTNGEKSGFYLRNEDGSLKEDPLKEFEIPYVNVPISEFMVTAADKNVYLTNTLTLDDLAKDSSVTIKENGQKIDLDPNVLNYGLKSWQNEFVDIEAASPMIPDETASEKLLEDTEYTLKVKISSKKPPLQISKGDAAETVAAEATANIYVYQPHVTFKDGEVYYGDAVPDQDYLSGLRDGAVEWKHGDTAADSNIMIGTAPTDFVFTITPTSDTNLVNQNVIMTKKDVPILVTGVSIDGISRIGDIELIGKTGIHRRPCDGDTPLQDGEGHFVLHVKTCELKINKAGNVDSEEPFVFTVYKDEKGVKTPYTSICIIGTGSRTFTGLPVGTYYVEEDTDWSWRYQSSIDKASVNLGNTDQTSKGEVTCTNTKKKDTWLNNFSTVLRNIFGEAKGKKVTGND